MWSAPSGARATSGPCSGLSFSASFFLSWVSICSLSHGQSNVYTCLAYLTNPSETSFRTFLTEQSFRQHLSRLDDNIDDHEHETNSSHHSSVRRNVSNNVHTLPFDNRSPFHFANRASVSLRTPKHVFHSFGIFTIAAIIPVTKSERGAVKSIENTSVICDSWYLGVFGRWWRGGVLESWYQDVFSRANDEESWSSGILGMKTTERHNEYSGRCTDVHPLFPSHLCSALRSSVFDQEFASPSSVSRISSKTSKSRQIVSALRASTTPQFFASAIAQIGFTSSS